MSITLLEGGLRARIIITLKKGVLDPQGKAVKEALENLGFDQVKGVRVGKVIDVTLDGIREREEAERTVEEMCRRLLANPVIEEFTYEVMGD